MSAHGCPRRPAKGAGTPRPQHRAGTLCCLLCLLVVPRGAVARGAKAVPDAFPETGVWFQDITRPVRLKPDEIRNLCRETFLNLKKSKAATRVGVQLPAGGGARAVFLSGFDGKRTAQVSFGTGSNLPAAVISALRRARAADFPGRKLRWLKIDVVQFVLESAGFRVRESPLPAPSFVGLAFGPRSGFAFLPEQLVAREMTDSRRRLTIHYINEQFAREKRWQELGRWSAISSQPGAQKVCFFETLSFFTDGERVIPLFRGHRLYTDPRADELLEAARDAGGFLVRHSSRNRLLDVTLHEWRAGVEDDITPEDYAATVLALVRLFRTTDDKPYLRCAERFGERLLDFLQPWGSGKRVLGIVEKRSARDVLRDGKLGDVAVLRTNALSVIALLELGQALGPDRGGPFLRVAPGLARHLLRQIQPGGEMIRARRYPSGIIEPVVGAVDSALGAEAFLMLYEHTRERVFLEHATAVMENLLQRYVGKAEMETLPRDPWLLEAIDRFYTFSHNRDWIRQAERIAAAILADQVRNTELLETDPRRRIPLPPGGGIPDLYGSVIDFPSLTAAADRSRALAIAARLLRDSGRRDAAIELLAETKPGVLFQLQARMLPETRMYMQDPPAYEGAFRDHLRDFGFDLRIQASQALSLLELHRALGRLGAERFPRIERVEQTLLATRRRLTRFPHVLSAELLPAATTPPISVNPGPNPGRPAPAPDRLIPLRPVPKR